MDRSEPYPWLSALSAAVALAFARAALLASKDAYLADGWVDMALWSFARHALAGTLWSAPFTLILAVPRSTRRARALSITALVLGGFLFVSARLPLSAIHVPGTDSGAGWIGNTAAAVAAVLCSAPFLFSGRRARWMLTGFSVAGVTAAAVALLLLRSPGARWPERPNVILISLDTTRASGLGVYGYDLPTSPEIDRFAERAVRFESAFTPFPWTLIAHGTMLTSLTPSAHGMDKSTALSEDVPTVAGQLRETGYRTAALVDRTARWVAPQYGLGSGFDLYRQAGRGAERSWLTNALLDDLGDGPFFLFLHYFDAHGDSTELPYDAAPADLELFVGDYRGAFEVCDPELGCGSVLLEEMHARGILPGEDDVAYIRGTYDAGLRTLDRYLGELLRDCERRGLFEKSVVVITSDHGENFYEHDVPHHRGPWDEAVRVPLLVRTPATTARVVEDVVGLENIGPTILSYCGVPTGEFPSYSLRPFIEGDGSWEGTTYALLDDGVSSFGIRTRQWKYGDFQIGGAFLFDLTADPGEQQNLIADPGHAQVRTELQALLDRELDRARERRALFAGRERTVTLSASDGELLRALGYADILDE